MLKAKLYNLHPIIFVILLGTFFCRAIYFASVPYLPMLLTSEKGISFDITSIILAINPLTTVCTSFFGGALIDKFGIKRTSFFLVIILFLILFWCLKNFNTFDFLIFSVLNGILFSVFETLAKKIISDFAFKNNKSMIFNFRITVINLGTILGPFLKIFIFKELSTLIFVLMFIYFAYSFLILIFYKNTQNTISDIFDIKAFEAIKFLWKDKIIVFLLIGGIFTFSGIAHLNSTIPQYFIKKSLYVNYGKMDLYSILLLVNSIMFIFVQYVILPFLKKKRFFFLIITGNLLISTSIALFPLFVSITSLSLIIMLFSIGQALFYVVIDTLIDSLSISKFKGTYFSITNNMFLGSFIGTLLGGIGIKFFRTEYIFYLFIFLALICMLGTFAILKSFNKLTEKNIRFT